MSQGGWLIDPTSVLHGLVIKVPSWANSVHPFCIFALCPPAVFHSQKMKPVSFKSQGHQQKLLTAVFEVNEKAEPSQSSWKAVIEQDGRAGPWWWWRWPSDQVSAWSPEDRIPSLLPWLKFCAWEVFNFSNPNCTQWGVFFFPLPTGLVAAPTPGPEGGGGINRMAGCQFDRGEV